jgi:cholesterol oxidase
VTYSVSFTETMHGWFGFGATDYQAGFEAGRRDRSTLRFRLTIGTDDIDRFVEDPTHAALAEGYVEADVLGGRHPVATGAFNLFVDDTGTRKRMLYRLGFVDGAGRPLTLAGFKDIRRGSLRRVWPDTSTLYTVVARGELAAGDLPAADLPGPLADDPFAELLGDVPDLVGAGVLHLTPLDFARQLTTFRAGGPSVGGRVQALDRFGRLFVGELAQTFWPPRW